MMHHLYNHVEQESNIFLLRVRRIFIVVKYQNRVRINLLSLVAPVQDFSS